MIAMVSRAVASAMALALAVGVFAQIAPIPWWQALMACVGWGLAYFGDDLAPAIGLNSTPSTSRYIDPFVRGIGWLFLLVAFGFYVARVLHEW